MTDYLERKLRRETLRYAVQRQITCPLTGVILDVRTAVLFRLQPEGRYACVTGTAYDRLVAQGIETDDVDDGRDLWS